MQESSIDPNKPIYSLLSGELSGRILYTIFVLGSKDSQWFTQKDLKTLLYMRENKKSAGGSGTFSNKLKELEMMGFIGYEHKELYPLIFKRDLSETKTVITKKETPKSKLMEYSINRSKKMAYRFAYFPKLDWFEKLYNIKLNDFQKELIFSYFKSLDEFNLNKENDKFPYHTDINILNIIRDGLKANYLNYHFGYWLFGDKFNTIKEEFLLESEKKRQDNKRKYGYEFISDKTNNTASYVLKKVLTKHHLDNIVNQYNINLIINAIYFSNISNKEIVDFNQLVKLVFNISNNDFNPFKFSDNSFFITAFISSIPEDQNYPYIVYKKLKV